MSAEHWFAIFVSTVIAATPLIYAALGELVVERAGVLNLGVEGMMLVGALTAFAVGHSTGSLLLGYGAAMLASMALALLFGFLTLTLQTNQVATGLALTLFGLGLSAFVGRSFTGLPIHGRRARLSLRLGRLRVDRLVRAGVGVPEAFPPGIAAARDRGIAFGGARARPAGHRHSLRSRPVRWRDERNRRRIPVDRAYAHVGRGNERRPRLDRTGARRIRHLEAGAGAARCLSVRRRHGDAALCARLWRGRTE